jgi:hypothetical protein
MTDDRMLREETIAAFCLAVNCERWEFKEERAREFFDLLDAYILARLNQEDRHER